MAADRTPVRTIADLSTLDEAEIVEGYIDGLVGSPCGDNRSRAYWHGHRNALADRHQIEIDGDMRALAAEIAMVQQSPARGAAP